MLKLQALGVKVKGDDDAGVSYSAKMPFPTAYLKVSSVLDREVLSRQPKIRDSPRPQTLPE
jgi:hypothetical protein